MIDNVKSFEVDGAQYNVARASAVQQDEILSILSQAIISKLAAAEKGEMVDEGFIFNFFLTLPYDIKQRIDELLLARIVRNGTDIPLSIKDFDGNVMAFNKLRAKVLIWNLEPFFVYWADVIKSGIEASKKAQASQAQ